MTEELPVQDQRVKDEMVYNRDGSATRVKALVFYLGKHGPFTERFAPEEFTAGEIGRRVELLRATLRQIG